jgi:protein tyrosine/serine phosphatase
MQYVAIPWHCYNKKASVFGEFLTLMRQNPDKKVFVHCRLGDDRTGMMVAAYRIAEQGWAAEEAMKEMQKFGFVWWHHLICPRLASYEENFPEKLKTSPTFACAPARRLR